MNMNEATYANQIIKEAQELEEINYEENAFDIGSAINVYSQVYLLEIDVKRFKIAYEKV